MATNEKMITLVENGEKLYRRVSAGYGSYSYIDGRVVFNSSAFNDRIKEPSVDRASLCDNDPNHTKSIESDGIVTLVAGTIRANKVPVNDEKGRIRTEYALDVIHRPSKNIAHAAIVPNPKYLGKKDFIKVKNRLARLATKAGWTMPPTEKNTTIQP